MEKQEIAPGNTFDIGGARLAVLLSVLPLAVTPLFTDLSPAESALVVIIMLSILLLALEVYVEMAYNHYSGRWRRLRKRGWWVAALLLASLGAFALLYSISPVIRQLKMIPDEGKKAPPIRDAVQPPVVGVHASPLARATRLASQLTTSEWVLNSESCSAHAISFSVEGDELVAYAKEVSEIPHKLINAKARTLLTEFEGRIIKFQIHLDGFTHVDREHERWFRRCG